MVNSESAAKQENEESSLIQKLSLLFITGFIMILVGIIILAVTATFYGDLANFGVIIFLWFIPIVVGTGPEPTWIILFATIIAVSSIIIFLISRRRMRAYHQ